MPISSIWSIPYRALSLANELCGLVPLRGGTGLSRTKWLRDRRMQTLRDVLGYQGARMGGQRHPAASVDQGANPLPPSRPESAVQSKT